MKKLFAFLVLALMIGAFFWMRSAASWRPQKIAVLPNSKWIALSLRDNQETLVAFHRSFTPGEKEQGNFLILDLTKNQKTTWKIDNFYDTPFYPRSGISGAFHWWVEGEDIKPSVFIRGYEYSSTFYKAEIRDLATGKIRYRVGWRTPPLENFVIAKLSTDGSTLRFFNDHSFFTFDFKTGKKGRLISFASPFKRDHLFHTIMAFSPDGTQVARAQNRVVGLWDIKTGKMLKRWKLGFDQSGYGGIGYFSPDARLAIGMWPGNLRFLDVETGKQRWELKFKGQHALKFSGDGRFVFVLEDEGCDVYEAWSGQKLRHLSVPRFGDGKIIQANENWIFTQDSKGQIWRWRAR